MSPPKKGRGPIGVEYRKTGEIKPSASNSRKHGPEQIDKIVRSIESIGWTKPIIIDEKDEILAGHGAHQAALQMGEETVPTIKRSGLTSAQKKAYRIADNKIAEGSEWDNNILAKEFAELTRMGFDMSLTGFNPTEIEFMLAPPPTVPPEPPAAEIQKRVITKLGDIWQLGEHRIICGDSTQPETYKALMQGRKAQCVFTDPPYGVSYTAASGKHKIIDNDEQRRGPLMGMLKNAFTAAMPHTREDAGWYIWHASKTRQEFYEAMQASGLIEQTNGYIIWEKPGTIGWTDYRSASEPCFYAARQGVKPTFYGDRTGTTIWKIDATRAVKGQPTSVGSGLVLTTPDGRELYVSPTPPKGKKLRHLHLDPSEPILLQPKDDVDDVWAVSRDNGHGKDKAIHPTMKPVELGRRACRNSTKEGDIVLDFFGGSCSTVMAAEQTKRIGYAIELDPHYVDASVRRWQDLTGKQATHAQEKKTFQDIAKARGKA